jgi:hypothetical protein
MMTFNDLVEQVISPNSKHIQLGGEERSANAQGGLVPL